MIDSTRKIDQNEFPQNAELEKQISFILRYAILAPSTHNSQPWLFRVSGGQCTVFYNPKLTLPQADPKTRDLHISIGCALENLILASRYFNMLDSVDNGPFEDRTQLAVIKFRQYAAGRDEQYKNIVDTITKRINARGFFNAEAVSQDTLDQIYSTVSQDYLIDGVTLHWITDKEKVRKLAQLTADGLKLAYRKVSFRKEMSRWMHHSLTEVKDGIPGYALRMPFLLSFVSPTLVRWFNLGGLLSKLNQKSLDSAPLVTLISSARDGRDIWIKVGRLAERLMLEFNNRGWQTSIFVAAIEMGELGRRIRNIVDINGSPQFLFVVGKIDKLHKHTPRHLVEDKLI